MRQNTSSPRSCLAFQCFHTCTSPSDDYKNVVLFIRGVNPNRISCRVVSFPQNEPARTEMLHAGSCASIHRFVAKIALNENASLQRYCFKITLFDENQKSCDVIWYSSLGMSRERPLLNHCFCFELKEDHEKLSNDLICYEIMPDRFATSSDKEKYFPSKLCDLSDFNSHDGDGVLCYGNLQGIISMLPYIKDLGINTLLLTPIFKARSHHKLTSEDFSFIDETLGGNEGLKKLRTKTLNENLKLILSIELSQLNKNHYFYDSEENTKDGASHNKESFFRDFFTFYGDNEVFCSDSLNENPKLNFKSKALREYLFKSKHSIIRRYLAHPYAIDGWLLSNASQIGDNGSSYNNFKRLKQICKSVKKTNKEAFVIGQFKSDARYHLTQEKGVDSATNYSGFVSPIRAFFGGVNLTHDSLPYTGDDLRRTCENYSVGVAQQIKCKLINLLDNYDLPRFFNIIGGEKSLYLAALATLFTWRGIPCLYQGDELGDLILKNNIDKRSPLPYKDMKNGINDTYVKLVKKDIQLLCQMRQENKALTLGSQIFIVSGGAYFGYIRLYQKRFSLVFVNASRQAMTIEQGSMLFPMLAAMYLPTNTDDKSTYIDDGENTLIPLSGKNVRRIDHGEGMEPLYELLSKEKLSIKIFGTLKNRELLCHDIYEELIAGKTITMPPRATVVINNSEK